MGFDMGWWMLLGGLWVVLFWGGIIALVIWVVKKITEGGSRQTAGRSAVDIARERYARGEITREQFEQLKKDLS